ncbi:UDP-glucose 4-epimerase [Elusimicrobium minutum Pei191]|uniref:UDP-glucose 4-epimerase n=1 Tax=Elusimicrobium minutum (strain Pei191) TaxID=445932 RepID=B2KC36_ELUMP|nr:UDP-glucose 4-epimerase GalE [Elusimicrobium minutum]ACC98163.1 UDP-glucose 4-epimerase [Elusimicrobium minutum Pei191]
MKNILVVGGAGYIGSNTVRVLEIKGYSPIVYDNLSKGHKKAVRGIPFIKGDLGDKKKLKTVFSKFKIDAVMHFAAFTEVGESVITPAKYYENNVAKVLNLLDAMVESGINYFVFSSTAATFGEPVKELIDETHPQNPINPYGRTKLMVENILKDYDHSYGLKSVCLRYFNACGASPDGKTGESHDPETHLIPLVFQAALGKRESIKVFGNDYPTPDGTAVRDYIHVNDLASAHILALEKMAKENKSAWYNLGSGSGYSVKEIIETVKEVTGLDFKVENAPRRAGDPAVLVADSAKAKQDLKWEPQFNLKEIIKTVAKWERKRKY